MSYLITTDTNVSGYLIALEDDFGFVPLFSTDDFDEALILVVESEKAGCAFTEETDELMNAL